MMHGNSNIKTIHCSLCFHCHGINNVSVGDHPVFQGSFSTFKCVGNPPCLFAVYGFTNYMLTFATACCCPLTCLNNASSISANVGTDIVESHVG